MWSPPRRMVLTSRFVICGKTIESHHWVRDVVFGEDRSRIRMQAAPQLMAAMRNAAETLIRRTGTTQITAARRHFAAHPATAFTLIRRRFCVRR